MLFRIQNALYNKPWLITPTVHKSMCSQLEAYLAGHKVDMPDGDEMPKMPMPNLEDEETDGQQIQVINLSGVIATHLSQMETACGGVDLLATAQQLKQAKDNPDVKGIILYINSPGGQVTGTPEFAELVSEVDKVKPVITFTDGQMCSAALWIGSQARAVYCTPTAEIGSIGCYVYLEDHSAAMAKDGIKPNPIVSDNTPFKLAGAYFKELTPEEKALFQADVNNVKARFVEAIKSKRQVNESAFDGRTFNGEDAVLNGLADGLVSSLEDCATLFDTV